MRVRLIISYDGTNYCGYQIQKNASSIQKCVEDAIFIVYNVVVKSLGASRTDSGVHAICQNVVFDIEESKIPIEKLYQILNRYLPKDIRVIKSMLVDNNFHPRYDSIKKTYNYTIYNGEHMPPFYNNYMMNVKKKLNVLHMREASKYFLGTHDFIGFSNAGSDVRTTVRTIFEFDIIEEGNIIQFHITGDGFLYNMVRIIIGTLIRVGMGKISVEDIPNIIESRDRSRAGKTAKPNGLVLQRIYYGVKYE